MKKTKHFNISVPELGDAPDITQVSNAISDLEDATAGTLEIMKAEMQGTKITLTSVSRKTKRTGYYEGMSIRFKSPQDIEPNYLKTISVDDLGDQELSVAYKVNRNEYIDIVYEGNKFTAYPVVVQKTDSVSENSSILVGTAKGVKTAYDKGVEAINKANQAQSSADKAQSTADGKVSKSGDTMTGALRINSDNSAVTFDTKYQIGHNKTYDHIYMFNGVSNTHMRLYDNGDTLIDAKNLNTSSKEVIGAINELNSGKENKIDKKSGFNLDKSDSVASNSSNTIATSLAVKTAYDKASQAQSTADDKVSKNGDTMTGVLRMEGNTGISFNNKANISFNSIETPTGEVNTLTLWNGIGNISMGLRPDGAAFMQSKNLTTKSKEAIAAINEINSHKVSKNGDTMTGGLKFKDTLYIATADEKVNMGYANGKGQFIIWNGYSQQSIALKDDGAGVFGAKNLNTLNKDVIKAVNELMAFTGYNHKIYGQFPLSSAVVGGLYLHEGNKSIYKCIKSYNGPLLSNPNNHFITMNTYQNNRMICQTVRVVKISGTGSEWKTIEYPETFWANNCAIFIQNTGNFTDRAPVFKINTDRTQYCAINFDGFYYEADMIFLKIWEE